MFVPVLHSNSHLLSQTHIQKVFSLPCSLLCVRVFLCFADVSGCTGNATEFIKVFHVKLKNQGRDSDNWWVWAGSYLVCRCIAQANPQTINAAKLPRTLCWLKSAPNSSRYDVNCWVLIFFPGSFFSDLNSPFMKVQGLALSSVCLYKPTPWTQNRSGRSLPCLILPNTNFKEVWDMDVLLSCSADPWLG